LATKISKSLSPQASTQCSAGIAPAECWAHAVTKTVLLLPSSCKHRSDHQRTHGFQPPTTAPDPAPLLKSRHATPIHGSPVPSVPSAYRVEDGGEDHGEHLIRNVATQRSFGRLDHPHLQTDPGSDESPETTPEEGWTLLATPAKAARGATRGGSAFRVDSPRWHARKLLATPAKAAREGSAGMRGSCSRHRQRHR
jgi:hypothetical protein